MAELITPKQFHEADGIDDWRVLWAVAFAVFRTGDFATGLKLVDEIGRIAEAAGHHPDLNVRAGAVEVRLVTKEHWSLTDLDLTMARQISAAAEALGVSADPDNTRTWEFALDALDVDKVRTFWCAVLGYVMVGDSDIGDPDDLYPPVYVQNASLEIAWTRVVLEGRTIAGEVLAPFLTEGYEGFDINDPADWMVAEQLLAAGAVRLPAVGAPAYQA